MNFEKLGKLLAGIVVACFTICGVVAILTLTARFVIWLMGGLF